MCSGAQSSRGSTSGWRVHGRRPPRARGRGDHLAAPAHRPAPRSGSPPPRARPARAARRRAPWWVPVGEQAPPARQTLRLLRIPPEHAHASTGSSSRSCPTYSAAPIRCRSAILRSVTAIPRARARPAQGVAGGIPAADRREADERADPKAECQGREGPATGAPPSRRHRPRQAPRARRQQARGSDELRRRDHDEGAATTTRSSGKPHSENRRASTPGTTRIDDATEEDARPARDARQRGGRAAGSTADAPSEQQDGDERERARERTAP